MTNPSSLDIVARLQELMAKATPGPWTVCGVRGKAHNIGKKAVFHDIGPDGVSIAAVWYQEKDGLGFIDAHLIVEAINSLPALFAHIDAVEKERRAEEVFAEDCNRQTKHERNNAAKLRQEVAEEVALRVKAISNMKKAELRADAAEAALREARRAMLAIDVRQRELARRLDVIDAALPHSTNEGDENVHR